MGKQQRKNDVQMKADNNVENNPEGLQISPPVDPVAEGQSEIRAAFQTYVESQRALLETFKEQAKQAKNANKDTERRYRTYEEIMDKAFKNREIMDNKALDLYRKAIQNAGLIYRETLYYSLQLCKQTTDLAWESSVRAHKPAGLSFSTRMKTSLNSIKNFLISSARNIKTKSIELYQRIENRFRVPAKTTQ